MAFLCTVVQLQKFHIAVNGITFLMSTYTLAIMVANNLKKNVIY